VNESFEIGEIVVINRPGHFSHHCEAQIISGPHAPNTCRADDGCLNANIVYYVNYGNDPTNYGWDAQFLRKKKPPKEDASWDRIQEITDWNPTKIEVLA